MDFDDLPGLVLRLGIGLLAILVLVGGVVFMAAAGTFGGGLGKHYADRFIRGGQRWWRDLKAACDARANRKVAAREQHERDERISVLQQERVNRRVRNQTRPEGRVRFGTVTELRANDHQSVLVQYDNYEPDLGESMSVQTRWSTLATPEAEQLAAARHDYPNDEPFVVWTLDPRDDPSLTEQV